MPTDEVPPRTRSVWPGAIAIASTSSGAGATGRRGRATLGGHGGDLRPDLARERVQSHADHFSHLVEEQLREYYEETGQPGVIASNGTIGLEP